MTVATFGAFALGLVLLTLGGEGLVRGSSGIARRFGITPLVIGLTGVAFGTSAPELVVSLAATFRGSPDIAVGNVVGSNVFNVLAILGLCALAKPLVVAQQLVFRDVPVMIVASLVVLFFGFDGRIALPEGVLLVAGWWDVDKPWESIVPWIETPVDLARVRAAARRFVVLHVLVPGARPDSVTAEVAERVRCGVVSPGANIPYAPGAVEVLHRRGIVAIPDFISNSGGVHLYESVEQDDEPEVALATIERLVAESVSNVLAAADADGITPLAAALREVRAYLAAETGAAENVLDELVAECRFR